MSSVFLVAVSNVLMPRVQSITFGLPGRKNVPPTSRALLLLSSCLFFKSTGLRDRPTFLSERKFRTLRAPICNISTYDSTIHIRRINNSVIVRSLTRVRYLFQKFQAFFLHHGSCKATFAVHGTCRAESARRLF